MCYNKVILKLPAMEGGKTMLRVLCCGSRNWDNQEIIDEVLSELPKDSIIMHCKAKGADTMAAAAAIRLGFKVEAFEDVDTSDESDTPTRAIKMLSHHPDLIIAFHGNIADSIGTKHIMRVAHSMHIPLKLVTNSRNSVSSPDVQAVHRPTPDIFTTNVPAPNVQDSNNHQFLSQAAAATDK